MTSVVDAPRLVSSDASPTRPECAVIRRSTPAAAAAAARSDTTVSVIVDRACRFYVESVHLAAQMANGRRSRAGELTGRPALDLAITAGDLLAAQRHQAGRAAVALAHEDEAEGKPTQ